MQANYLILPIFFAKASKSALVVRVEIKTIPSIDNDKYRRRRIDEQKSLLDG